MTNQLNVVMKANLPTEDEVTTGTQTKEKKSDIEEIDFDIMFPEENGYSFTALSDE